SARFFDRSAVVLAEVGNGLVIGREPPQQPHYFQIAMALALEPPARLHAIEIAVDVELEVDRGVIPRPSDVQRLDRLEAQFLQIKPVNERIDAANRIILADPVIEASRQPAPSKFSVTRTWPIPSVMEVPSALSTPVV